MPCAIHRRTAGKILAGLPILATGAGGAASAQGNWPPAAPLASLLAAVPPPDLAVTGPPPIGYFMYARLDLMVGAAGPAMAPGAVRFSSGPHDLQNDAIAIGYTELRFAMGRAAEWPQLGGFDLDAIDAVLVPLAAAENPPSPPVLLAGAARLTDAGAIGRALEARGALRRMEAGRLAWSLGEPGQFRIGRGDPADPLRGRFGKPVQVATLPQALLIAYAEADLAAMLRAATAGPTIAGIPGMRSVLRSLGEDSTGSDLVQAFCFPPMLWVENPVDAIGPFGRPATLPPPVLAPYLIGGMAQVRRADGSRRDRIALFYLDRTSAEGGAAALLARVRGWEAGPQRIGLAGIASRVEPTGAAAGALAVLEVIPAAAAGADGRPPSPFLAWYRAFIARQPVPMTVGPTPPFRRD